MEMQKETIEVQCADGVKLKGILLIPAQPKAVVQFNCGTATKKEFYLAFLSYLAENGYVCCLWDYRGSGDSRPATLKGCEFAYRDYGLQDMPAVKTYLQARFPELPFLLFGHSAGGQQVGLMPDLKGIKGMVNFAVSTGYAPNMPTGYRLRSFYFFRIFTPLSILFTGYLKAKKFGYMEDLPKNVVREWRDWCAKKDYLFDSKFLGKTIPTGVYHDLPFPIHTFWTVDDEISNEKNTQNFWRNMRGRHPITFTRLEPAALGLKGIGHFGFFRKEMKDLLWVKALEQLDGYLG
jgi:predicted alpha/beta hydrolase